MTDKKKGDLFYQAAEMLTAILGVEGVEKAEAGEIALPPVLPITNAYAAAFRICDHGIAVHIYDRRGQHLTNGLM